MNQPPVRPPTPEKPAAAGRERRPRREHRAWLLVPALAAAAAGCDAPADPLPTDPSLAGSWFGTTDDGSGAIHVNLDLSDSDGDIAGFGQLSGPAGVLGMAVEGTRDDADFGLAFDAPGFETITYTGALTAPTAMEGTIHGSGSRTTS